MALWSPRTSRYWARKRPAATNSSTPSSAAERDQLVGIETALARAGQHRVDLAREAAGADCRAQRLGPPDRLGVVGQQLLQHDVLLRRGEQPQRGGVQLGGGVATDQAVGERVERRAQGGRHGAAEAGGDPVAQLLGGLAGEGEREHALRARRRCSIRSAIASTRVVVLPVPGPARTRSGPPGWSTTRCCWASSVGAAGAAACRTRRYVVGAAVMSPPDHPGPTPRGAGGRRR